LERGKSKQDAEKKAVGGGRVEGKGNWKLLERLKVTEKVKRCGSTERRMEVKGDGGTQQAENEKQLGGCKRWESKTREKGGGGEERGQVAPPPFPYSQQ
jgi:hypothetical protein